jgi:enamine deaminase RidA (YjgF/YER057c/UK114 family)
MRKRIYNWQGQRFAYIWLGGEPGQSLEKQSQGLFDRAGPELASLGLALDKNVVRTRVYGRTRDARNIVSAARGRAFSGQARAATSSFISPDHLDWYSDVALELWAMTAPTEGVPRKVTEMEPVAVFIRHLVWGPLVFHAGMTNDELPTLKEQCAEILARAGARLKENGCDWGNVVRVSFMLHKSEKPQSVLDIASAIVPVPLENAEIELVEGYSTPGKLVEIEVTARR